MPVSIWNGKKTKQIDLLEPGEYVVVKATLGRDDRKAIQSKLMSAAKVTIDGDIDGYDVGVAYDASEFATLETVVLEGRFKDEESGDWIKLTRANKASMLRALDDPTRDHLIAELNKLYPPALKDDEALNSGSNGTTPVSTPETESQDGSVVTP